MLRNKMAYYNLLHATDVWAANSGRKLPTKRDQTAII